MVCTEFLNPPLPPKWLLLGSQCSWTPPVPSAFKIPTYSHSTAKGSLPIGCKIGIAAYDQFACSKFWGKITKSFCLLDWPTPSRKKKLFVRWFPCLSMTTHHEENRSLLLTLTVDLFDLLSRYLPLSLIIISPNLMTLSRTEIVVGEIFGRRSF